MARIKIGEGFGKGCTKAARKSALCRQSYSEDCERVSEEENRNGKSPPKSPRRCVATKAARKSAPCRQSYSEDSESVSEEKNRNGKSPPKSPRRCVATKAARKSAPVRQSYSEDSELFSEEESRHEKAPRKQLATKANGLSTAPNAVGGHDTKRQRRNPVEEVVHLSSDNSED